MGSKPEVKQEVAEVKATEPKAKPKAKKAPVMKAYRFVKNMAPYHKGEIAGFNDKEVKKLLDANIVKKA